MATLLEQAKATAVLPEQKSPKQLDAEIHALRCAQDTMFGIENISQHKLKEAAFRLSQDKKFLGTGYKRLSLEPLSWSAGVLNVRPTFAIYSIDSSRMILDSGDSGEGYGVRHRVMEPGAFPEKLATIYGKHAINLGGDRKKYIRITSFFNGVIPAQIRPEIQKAIEFFSIKLDSGQVRKNVFIMAEAKIWQTAIIAVPQPPRVWLDPLVVGWDGTDLWLITSFDITPLESYVAKEFPALEAPRYLTLPAHK